MRKPHTSLRRIVLILVALCAPAFAHARSPLNSPRRQDAAKPSQESKEPRATDEGDAARAEETCARAEEFSRQGDTRGALKALGESVKLYKQIYLGARAPINASAPDSAASFRTEMAARLRRAPACIELYARLGGPEGANDFEREQLEALHAHAAGLTESDASRAVFFGPETDEKAVITYNPPPRFPREARPNVGYGKVRLRLILGADGEVRHVLVLSGQPAGLSESSVETAKTIKFKPATKGGRPVSQFVTVEHSYKTF